MGHCGYSKCAVRSGHCPRDMHFSRPSPQLGTNSQWGSLSSSQLGEKSKNIPITLLRVIPTMTSIRFVTGKSPGVLAGISSGILSGISSGILSGISSGISSGILPGISSEICSGISSGTLSGILSGKSSAFYLPNILAGTAHETCTSHDLAHNLVQIANGDHYHHPN